MTAISTCTRFDTTESLHFFSEEFLKTPQKFVEEANRIARVLPITPRTYHFSLCRTASEGHVRVAKEIIKIAGKALLHYADGIGWTPLIWAIMEDKYTVVRCFIQYKEGINTLTSTGKSPLWLATKRGKLPFVKILLKNGAIAHPELNEKQRGVLQRAQKDIADEITIEGEQIQNMIPSMPLEVCRIIAEFSLD